MGSRGEGKVYLREGEKGGEELDGGSESDS